MPVPSATSSIISLNRSTVVTEPPVLAPGGGASRLRAAGVSVVDVPELAAAARAVNAHLIVG